MSLFDSLLLLIDQEPHPASLNMAVDEVVLKESSVPILRAYRWSNPSASFGYFESHSDVAKQHPGRDLVRRWTGGGVVLHGEDFTYSLMVPAGSSFLKLRAARSYMAIHRLIAKTMQESGIPASMAQNASPKISRACFENAVPNDVLLENRKIAGAAQRRSKFGLLHQGSIQYANLDPGFGEMLARNFAGRIVRRMISAAEMESAKILSANKYETDEWLRKF